MYTPSLVRPKGGNRTPKLKYWSKILARIAVRSVRAGKVAHYRTTQHQPKQIKEPNLPSNNLPSNKSPACDNQTAQATLPSRHTISPPEPKGQARKNNNVTPSQNKSKNPISRPTIFRPTKARLATTRRKIVGRKIGFFD